MAIVTISCEMGSGGVEIGRAVAERLGYRFVDTELITEAAHRYGLLEEKLSLEQAKRYREYYFGAVDENRIVFGIGKNIRLNPVQSGEPLLYFMYPYAEADGKPLNEDLYGFNLGYRIGYRAH